MAEYRVIPHATPVPGQPKVIDCQAARGQAGEA